MLAMKHSFMTKNSETLFQSFQSSFPVSSVILQYNAIKHCNERMSIIVHS